MASLNDLRTKYEQEMQQLAQTKKLLEEKTIENNKNTYSKVFKIYARPSKSNHRDHTVGYCSTMELARKQIGSGSSYDDDDNCEWFYTIEECDINSLDNGNILSIDKLPSHFPYTGW